MGVRDINFLTRATCDFSHAAPWLRLSDQSRLPTVVIASKKKSVSSSFQRNTSVRIKTHTDKKIFKFNSVEFNL